MGLNEDVVNLLEIDRAGLVAHGFDERRQTEVAGPAQQALGGADDEGQGVGGEGVVAQAGAVELGQDEGFGGLGSEAGQDDRIGDPGTNLLVDRERERLEQRRLGDFEAAGPGRGNAAAPGSLPEGFRRSWG